MASTFPRPAERVDRFEEAVEIISSLMSQERTTFEGRHYRLDDAPLEPRPVQQPRIPILVAAHRPRMLRIAARYADQWDTFAEMPGAATDGVTSGLADQLRALDDGLRRHRPRPGQRSAARPGPRPTFGRARRPISTSCATTSRIGFTDLTTVLPGADSDAAAAARRCRGSAGPPRRKPECLTA